MNDQREENKHHQIKQFSLGYHSCLPSTPLVRAKCVPEVCVGHDHVKTVLSPLKFSTVNSCAACKGRCMSSTRTEEPGESNGLSLYIVLFRRTLSFSVSAVKMFAGSDCVTWTPNPQRCEIDYVGKR